jgi:hypothetical protein
MANLYNHPFALTLKQSALQPAHTLVISGNAARLSSVTESACRWALTARQWRVLRRYRKRQGMMAGIISLGSQVAGCHGRA